MLRNLIHVQQLCIIGSFTYQLRWSLVVDMNSVLSAIYSNLLTRWHNTSFSTSTVTTFHIAITVKVVLTGVRTRHVADVSVVVINHEGLFNHGTNSWFGFLLHACILTPEFTPMADARFTLCVDFFPTHVPLIARFAALNIKMKTQNDRPFNILSYVQLLDIRTISSLVCSDVGPRTKHSDM